jgi:spore maturation protein CgeB
MRVAYFTHSLASCWNHGNAHFQRGVLRELARRGHPVAAYEPEGAWSLENLKKDHGEVGLEPWREAYPELASTAYRSAQAIAESACADADLVIVHEWSDPGLVAEIGRLRAGGGRFRLLFHDTHHRVVSDPEAMSAFDLSGYDGVLAFGETVAEVYRSWGWGNRVFVWHEAADISLFHPPARPQRREGGVFIGNWGDGERAEELGTFLLEPAAAASLPLDVYGVRYPAQALQALGRRGARYHGWLPNVLAPRVFAGHRMTVHVPRRFYVERLPGIPTIRVFEALACGIPLICAPWRDSEHLFRPGVDYLVAADGQAMAKAMRTLMGDEGLCAHLARHGLETIRARHTCAHRVDELLVIAAGIGLSPAPSRLEAAE